MKKILLFFTPLLITTGLIVGYFKFTQAVSTIELPRIPNISFSDLVKLSRFSLEKAPTQSLVGKIISMNGEVLYEPRLATESAKISSLQEVQQGESLSTGKDGEINLIFDKAAEIKISPNTTIGIIQTLPADLVFSQKIGTIEYKKLGEIPVSIRSYHLLIENDGNIKVSIAEEKPIVTVEVIKGSAKFAYNNINNDTRYLEVSAGKKLIFNDDTRRVVQE
jgi:hypothetical protein